jgi:hypothetical protein
VGSCNLLHRSLTLQGNSLSGTLPSGLFAMPDLEYVSPLVEAHQLQPLFPLLV